MNKKHLGGFDMNKNKDFNFWLNIFSMAQPFVIVPLCFVLFPESCMAYIISALSMFVAALTCLDRRSKFLKQVFSQVQATIRLPDGEIMTGPLQNLERVNKNMVSVRLNGKSYIVSESSLSLTNR